MSEQDHITGHTSTADGSWLSDAPSKEGGTPQSKTFKILIFAGRSILAALVLSVAVVLCLRWVPPPTTAFMIERYLERLFQGEKQPAIHYRWVECASISPEMALAVIAAEDQMFPYHCGFDFESISEALERNKKRGRLRGASTITQQAAKNLFLWSGRSYVRKGLEAYFTILLESLLSKNRILEIYLNIVQFGDGIYGVNAAAETLLGKSSSKLTRRDAALLAAVLPNPKLLTVRNPSRYVIQRRRWIEHQMEQLGGTGYLASIK